MDPDLALTQYKKINEYEIFLVDDYRFRNKSLDMQEFGAFATHLDFPIIPQKQIWISKYLQEKERDLFIENAIKQLDLSVYGVERFNAYETALVLEKNLRIKVTSIGNNFADQIYVSKYIEFSGITVHLVDGYVVRNNHKTDFVEGGHGYVYSWIPKNEIWVEKDMNPEEMPIIVLHEYLEMTLMKEQYYQYSLAHQIASRVEFNFRPNKFKKEEISTLNKDKALELIDKFK